VDLLAERSRLRFNTRKAQSLVARGQMLGTDVAVAKPQTYMNLSGRAVKQLVMGWGLPLRSLTVVYDEVDLPLGVVRLRERGGPGTHNGMRSIVESLGSQDFPRLRIGVGAPPPMHDLANYVLADPPPDEAAALEEAVERAVQALLVLLREGASAAMNQFNR
jgi:PTH1 family peptidyl-tRNA hydrolase